MTKTKNSTRTRDEEILKRWMAGEAGAAIGRDLGLSRQAVSYVIRRDSTYGQRRERERLVLEARRAAAAAAPSPTPPPAGRKCPVCGGELPAGRRVTDTPECAEAWRAGARFKDPQAAAVMRVRVATATLRNREQYDPAKVRWAEGVIERQGAPARAA